MMGIVTYACPDPEGMNRLQTVCTASMPRAAACAGRLASESASPFTIVSITCASASTTWMVRAKPISRAVAVISEAPRMNARAAPSGLSPPAAAASRPMPRNTADSSARYQPRAATP